MKVTLPRMETIDIDNIPNDIKERVQKAFSEFTEGTNPDYMYCDQLHFIDICVARLHKSDEDDDIDDMILDWVKYELHEQGQLPENEEVFGYNGLIQAYRLGKSKHEMYSHEYGTAKHDSNKCMKLLIEIIKAVMSYERN